MPLMEKALFEAFADSLARQVSGISSAAASIPKPPSGYYGIVTSTGDPDVELPMLSRCHACDRAVSANAFDAMVEAMALKPLMVSFGTHVDRLIPYPSGRWDSYCDAKEAVVHEMVSELHNATFGRQMYARNVFKPTETVLGRAAPDASGVWTLDPYPSGNLRTGGFHALASGNQFAPSRVVARVESGLNEAIALEVCGIGEYGPVSGQVAVGTQEGFEGEVTGARFFSLTSVSKLFGSGSVGSIVLTAVVERDI